MAFVPEASEHSWLRQVHGSVVRPATVGCAGEGDGLVTSVADRALVLVTADCVPVLITDGDRIGAAHAGWRGIANGVVGAVLEELPGASEAWIGPSIGPCCYEVSEDVAAKLAAIAGSQVVHSRASARPTVDLLLAVECQLRDRGVGRVGRLGPCTRCCEDLWSYRRDGSSAGRNLSAIWRSGDALFPRKPRGSRPGTRS